MTESPRSVNAAAVSRRILQESFPGVRKASSWIGSHGPERRCLHPPTNVRLCCGGFPNRKADHRPISLSLLLQKTYLMVQTCDRESPDVACWFDGGTAFVVKDTAKFASDHLPQYFRHSNFQSFVRQLNIYGFRKDSNVTGLPAANIVFRHESFRKDHESLLDQVRRVNKKPSKPKASAAANIFSKQKESSDGPTNLHLQIQIEELSEKMDVLIALMTGKDLPDQKPHSIMIPTGSKRRREAASVSDASQETYDHQQASGRAARMDVVEEEKSGNMEPLGYKDLTAHELDAVDLTNFADTPLVYDNELVGGEMLTSELEQQPGRMVQISSAAATKSSGPAPISDSRQQFGGNQATANVVLSSSEGRDLEGGTHLPVIEAVQVDDDDGKVWFFKREMKPFRLCVIAGILLILVANIIWPIMVFAINDKGGRRPPPKNGPNGQDKVQTLLDELDKMQQGLEQGQGGQGQGGQGQGGIQLDEKLESSLRGAFVEMLTQDCATLARPEDERVAEIARVRAQCVKGCPIDRTLCRTVEAPPPIKACRDLASWSFFLRERRDTIEASGGKATNEIEALAIVDRASESVDCETILETRFDAPVQGRLFSRPTSIFANASDDKAGGDAFVIDMSIGEVEYQCQSSGQR